MGRPTFRQAVTFGRYGKYVLRTGDLRILNLRLILRYGVVRVTKRSHRRRDAAPRRRTGDSFFL